MANKNLIFVHGMGEGNHQKGYDELFSLILIHYQNNNRTKLFFNEYNNCPILWASPTNQLQKNMYEKVFKGLQVDYFPEPFGDLWLKGVNLRDRLKSFIHFYFGDAIAYTTKNDNHIRSEMIKQIAAYVQNDFSIVAHSLGSVVISDILLHTKKWVKSTIKPPTKDSTGLSQEDFDFYSGLENKININFDNFATKVQNNLKNFFSIGSNISLFLQQDLTKYGSKIAPDAEAPINEKQFWGNFYDIDDFLAYPIKPMFDQNNIHNNIQDVIVDTGNEISSHGNYWTNDKVAKEISLKL